MMLVYNFLAISFKPKKRVIEMMSEVWIGTIIVMLVLCGVGLYCTYEPRAARATTTNKKHRRTMKPYKGILIPATDVLSYSTLEAACQYQVRGRKDTKRLILTDQNKTPMCLYMRSHQRWFRLEITPNLRKQAKEMYDLSEDDHEGSVAMLKMEQCRLSDVVDTILSTASRYPQHWLITQSRIDELGETYGAGIRVPRRALMEVMMSTDGV